jgi:hypothetical protein
VVVVEVEGRVWAEGEGKAGRGQCEVDGCERTVPRPRRVLALLALGPKPPRPRPNPLALDADLALALVPIIKVPPGFTHLPFLRTKTSEARPDSRTVSFRLPSPARMSSTQSLHHQSAGSSSRELQVDEAATVRFETRGRPDHRFLVRQVPPPLSMATRSGVSSRRRAVSPAKKTSHTCAARARGRIVLRTRMRGVTHDWEQTRERESKHDNAHRPTGS